MNYVKIGEKVRKYRKAKGMSQETLAERIGISVTHMSHIETGNTKLSLPVLVDLTRALEVQADDLLSDGCTGRSFEEKELAEILATCSAQQVKIILDVIRAVKTSLDMRL